MDRKNDKPSLIAIILLIVIAGISSCQATSQQSSISLVEEIPTTPQLDAVDPIETYTIALVMKTLTNPFFVKMEKGARRAEAELGINLVVKTAAQETSIEQQISIIEDLIQSDVDAVVIAPGDSVELIPILKKAQDNEITLINIDNRLDPQRASEIGLEPIPFISVDNAYGAYLSAKHASSTIQAPTQAAILEGIPTAQNAIDRKSGAMKAFAENSNITVVASETANWKIDEAYQVTQEIFAKHPAVGVLFAANDMMALGAIQFLQETGRTQVRVAGFDALGEARAAIRAGDLQVTIDQQAAQQGYLGVHYALQALEGKELPPETKVDIVVVDPANAAED